MFDWAHSKGTCFIHYILSFSNCGSLAKPKDKPTGPPHPPEKAINWSQTHKLKIFNQIKSNTLHLIFGGSGVYYFIWFLPTGFLRKNLLKTLPGRYPREFGKLRTCLWTPNPTTKWRFLTPKDNPGGINPHLKVMLLNYLQEEQFLSGLYMFFSNVLINHVYVFTLGENISGLRKPGGEWSRETLKLYQKMIQV